MDKREIENVLKDYHWMLNSIKIMRESMEQAGEGMTAQYGIESTLPKPKGQNGDPVHREVVRRSKRWQKIQEYEDKVKELQNLFHVITDERETEILHWMLEGKGYRWIASHMSLSERHIRRIKDSIVSQMSAMSEMSQTTQNCAC